MQFMADVSALAALDPYDLQDAECTRLSVHFASLDAAGWAEPSGCEGWSVRDLLGHLVAVEEYFAACLSWGVGDLMQRYAATGAGSLDEFNAAGVAASKGIEPAELLATWHERNAANRAGFRAADGQDIDTSVGAYPARLQAFHVAFEYAIHAQDAGAHVAPDERGARQDWLAAVARFALTEVKPDVEVVAGSGGFVVSEGTSSATLTRDDFVAGVSGRAAPGRLDEAAAALVDLGY